jgi:hypothetical protein
MADGDENGRPTIRPSFDMEAFARDTTGARDDLRTAEKPTVRPPPPAPLPGEFDPEKYPESPTTRVVPRPPRSLSPNSIEGALLGAIEGSAAPVITERAIDDPAAEMRLLLSVEDFAGALELADLILAEDPGNADAIDCQTRCQRLLEGVYAARLGSFDRSPVVVRQPWQGEVQAIDHRAGFLLSLLGSSTVEAVLDLCGMPKLDALRILDELMARGIVAFR